MVGLTPFELVFKEGYPDSTEVLRERSRRVSPTPGTVKEVFKHVGPKHMEVTSYPHCQCARHVLRAGL